SLPTPPSRRGDGRQPEAPLGGSCCLPLISVRASWKGAALPGQARCRGSIQLHNRDNPKCQILHGPSDTSNSILRGGLISPSSSTPPTLPSGPRATACAPRRCPSRSSASAPARFFVVCGPL